MRIEVISDVVCPWCYIGKRRLEKALASFDGDVEVVYRPYQLDPNATSDGTPLKEALGRRYGAPAVPRMIEHAAAAGHAEGLTMDWDRAVGPRTSRRTKACARRRVRSTRRVRGESAACRPSSSTSST
ncbi:MAG TPA: DsbA family protein [Gemmatimonadaceae bacterium]|nr:DsbA family protein [Gemmatimonadaceae bacterium]